MQTNAKYIEKTKTTVQTLTYTSQMMRNLMMDLLDLGQIETCTFKLNKDYFSIFDAIEQAFEVIRHEADKKNVKLIVMPIENVLHTNIY